MFAKCVLNNMHFCNKSAVMLICENILKNIKLLSQIRLVGNKDLLLFLKTLFSKQE